LGFSIQKYGVVHYFRTNGEVIHMPCRHCVLRDLISVAPLVDQPRFENGVFIFKFLHNRALAKRLTGAPHFTTQLVSLRKVFLSARQREAFRLFAEGGLRRVTNVLGVSKPTASRLVKRALQKLACQYS